MEKALELTALSLGKGKRTQPMRYESAYWVRFCCIVVCLFAAAVMEVWLLPVVIRILLV